MNKALARAIDAFLEGTVVLSFSRVGYQVRSRTAQWEALPSLEGRWIVITGATSGLGLEAAESMAVAGANVILIGRNEEKTKGVCATIAARHPQARLFPVVADTGSLDAVRRAAEAIAALTDTVHVLIHNAGAIAPAFTTNADGLEVTVASQVVGPFLLTSLLEPLLIKAAPGRVLTMSSGGMYSWRFSLADMVMTPANFDGVKAYARVKRAQVVLTHELALRHDPRAILFASTHPGWSDTPGLAESLPGFYRFIRRWLRTPAQGIDTLLWLLTTPALARHDGHFFLDRRPRGEYKIPGTRAKDPRQDQQSLYEWCVQQTTPPAIDVQK